MNHSLKAFIYVTSWIGAWVAFSLLINAGFLTVNLYSEESNGKIITLFISGIISFAGSYSLYREVFSNDQ